MALYNIEKVYNREKRLKVKIEGKEERDFDDKIECKNLGLKRKGRTLDKKI